MIEDKASILLDFIAELEQDDSPKSGHSISVLPRFDAPHAVVDRAAEPFAASVGVVTEVSEGVECVVIRIPICRKGPSLPGSNPVQTMRLAGSERHIRDAWGKVLHGCRLAGVKMASGKPVKTVADSLKYVLEQVSVEIG